MLQFRHFLSSSVATACLTAVGMCADLALPRPSHSAEEIRITVTGPIVLTVSVESLETFAETGEIARDLKLYTRFLSDSQIEQVQAGLSYQIPLDLVTVDNFAYSPLGRDALFNFGKVIQSTSGENGLVALRAAAINAAANANGESWTPVDVLRAFPTQSIDISLRNLLDLTEALSLYFDYNQAAIAAIETQAETEAIQQLDLGFADLPDLSQPGPFSFQQETFTVTNPALRQTVTGLSVNYDFDSDIYIPNYLPEPAPIIIISHGFGDVKESFTFLAEHLASYGFIVILPDHVGSDLAYRKQYLNGRLNTLLSPVEFINRPQENFVFDRQIRRAVCGVG